jgi:hypothetical protein
MSDSRQAANPTATRGFPSHLRWALLAAPLLILAAGVVQFYWLFSPLSVGASITAKTGVLGAIVASVSAMLGAYRLVRFPASRNTEAFVLISINALICLAGFALLFFRLTSPPSGSIAVKYDGMSASGVFWVLENQSTQSIYIRGGDTRVWPGHAITTCKAWDYGSEQSDPPQLADGYFSAMKIVPGRRIRLDVPTDLPNQFKRGHCRVRLELEGGTFVESYDFTPE